MTTPNETAPNPIPAPVQALLTLFEAELAEVKFPDVDGKVLKEAADRVRSLADEVSQAEAALEAAQKALQEGQETLLQRGQRALAYARIFAEGTPELTARLDAIVFGRAPRRAAKAEVSAPEAVEDEPVAPKRRGRPPKARPTAEAASTPEMTSPANGAEERGASEGHA